MHSSRRSTIAGFIVSDSFSVARHLYIYPTLRERNEDEVKNENLKNTGNMKEMQNKVIWEQIDGKYEYFRYEEENEEKEDKKHNKEYNRYKDQQSYTYTNYQSIYKRQLIGEILLCEGAESERQTIRELVVNTLLMPSVLIMKHNYSQKIEKIRIKSKYTMNKEKKLNLDVKTSLEGVQFISAEEYVLLRLDS
ncbi:MAG: hypothetical protein EZS28_001274 [Streblomastix strix]|uniref:Uncharacterized protein n=1 Tax=Streblomastix strix TaxID=222440 RepID=A0A5J4X7L7_9EUKA|nr:MAG: hypothetical protein EZS28_001274 [Streblomastix strix]